MPVPRLVISFVNFDLLFRTNFKLVYTLLEIFTKVKNIIIVGSSDDYNYLKNTDPRIQSRFPRQVYYFERINYDGLADWFEESLIVNNINYYEKIKLEAEVKMLIKQNEAIGASFEAFYTAARLHLANLSFEISELASSGTTTISDVTCYQNLRKSMRLHQSSFSQRLGKTLDYLRNSHVILIIAYFEAKSQFCTKISYENIYVKYCANLKELHMLKQSPMNVLLLLRELVALNLLKVVKEGRKCYYEIEGSFTYLRQAFQKLALTKKISIDVSLKIERISF